MAVYCSCTHYLRPDDYLTDEDPQGSSGKHRGSGGSGRAGSSSSASSAGVPRSRWDRDGVGGRGGSATDWGGVAGRGPPVAPQCDYVVDKILGRKVFMVPVRPPISWGMEEASDVALD